ncbi:MAG: chalcone isomerase family protein [Verrucomicrobiota bacterium]
MKALQSVLLALLIPFALNAKDRMPETSDLGELRLEKLGEHRFVYAMLFKLYDAALYVPAEATADDVLQAETTFELRFSYLRTIKKDIVLRSASRMLEKNLNPEEQQQIAERVAQINECYRTVSKGDSSALVYEPEVGTSFVLNGERKITIPGQDFARLYFTIWLGEQPASVSLRDDLLGR